MTPAPFVIRSAKDGASLALDRLDATYLLAALRGPAVEARARLWLEESLGLAAFLADLAASWRGWEGSKPWGTLEGELSIEATSDRSGHISLAVRLRDALTYDWSAEGVLLVEAGQLGGLASRAEAFEQALYAAP